ncbi:MAG: glycosyltransferase family 4 protein [Leptolyngbyaceae cyanobacterium]
MERRTLFLVQTKPYPLSGGVSLRNWQNINLLAEQGDLAIFSLYKGSAGSLPVAAHWYHYDLSAPSRSTQEKIRRRLWRLRPAGHPRIDWLYTQDAANQLRAQIAAYKPTLIIIEEIWLYRYLRVLQEARCPIILDNHNVEGDNSRYQGADSKTLQRLSKVQRIEKKMIQTVDQVWMCSQEDVRRLYELYPVGKTTAFIVPNGVNPDYYKNVCQQRQNAAESPKIKTILYLGRFSYQPNAEAASILLNQIYPAIRQIDNSCKLLLVGCDPTDKMVAAAKADPQIVVTGQVKDVRPYLLGAGVMVVPLLKGSGTRLKLLEAFAAKCPVISTAKGAEGLHVEDGKHVLLRESPTAMVEAIQQLWQQPQMAQTLCEQAYKRLLEQYAWPAVGQQIQDSLARLSDTSVDA